MTNSDTLLRWLNEQASFSFFSNQSLTKDIFGKTSLENLKNLKKLIKKTCFDFKQLNNLNIVDEHGRISKQLVLKQLIKNTENKNGLVIFAQLINFKMIGNFIVFNDKEDNFFWIKIGKKKLNIENISTAISAIKNFENNNILMIPSGNLVKWLRPFLKERFKKNLSKYPSNLEKIAIEIFSHSPHEIIETINKNNKFPSDNKLTHLDYLEAEAIHIIREVISDAKKPVMMYSIGKDSSVMLHLARKAFYPSRPPFPLLHIDTKWKFQEMYDFRDYMAKESGMDLIVHINQEGALKNINPFDHGSALHTDIMKTQSLKMALDLYKFDVAFGGARRDEEKSRAKERIFSFRTNSHRWDPKNQRPELWNLYNGKKNNNETIRVFPLSNWTELDIWQYIYREEIPIVPLYFAAERPVVERDGMLIMVDDDRIPINNDEIIKIKKIRFRTLGCYPLTGAFESDADNLESIVLELLQARSSERQGRAIDSDTSSSMEIKKQEGYF